MGDSKEINFIGNSLNIAKTNIIIGSYLWMYLGSNNKS